MASKRLFAISLTLFIMVVLAELISALLARQIGLDRLQTNYASFLADIGLNKDALVLLDQVIERDSQDGAALFRKGEIFYVLGEDAQGLETFMEVTKLRPRSAMSWIYLSYFLLEADRFDETVKAADKAIALGPPHPYAWNNRGVGLAHTGRPRQAWASFDKAIELDPEYFHALNNKAHSLYRYGRTQEALGFFDQAVSLKPRYDSYEAWQGRGLALIELRRYDQAISSLEKASALNPGLAKIWANLGLAYACAGRRDEAASAFTRARSVGTIWAYPEIDKILEDPEIGRQAAARYERGQFFFRLGERLRASGRYEAALVAYEKSSTFAPEAAERARAECLRRLDRLEEALSIYDRLIGSNPSDDDLLRTRTKILQEL